MATAIYCLMSPDWVAWICVLSALLIVPRPWAPTCSPHPRSKIRVVSVCPVFNHEFDWMRWMVSGKCQKLFKNVRMETRGEEKIWEVEEFIVIARLAATRSPIKVTERAAVFNHRGIGFME